MKRIIYLLTFLFAGSANATLIAYSDIATWNANVSVVGSNDYNHYTTIAYFGPSHYEDGVTYSGGALYGQGNNNYAGSQWIGEKWFSFERAQQYGMSFGQNLTALSFNFADYYDGNMDLTLLFNTGESINVNQGGTNAMGFIGITTDNAFSSVQLIPSNTQGDYFGIDNLAYGNTSAVPEPTTVVLLGLGLAGIGFSRKKKAA